MPVSAVKTRLGNDVSLWCQMLSEAKAARAVVENSDREKSFGPVIVDYSSVQAKVRLSRQNPHLRMMMSEYVGCAKTPGA